MFNPALLKQFNSTTSPSDDRDEMPPTSKASGKVDSILRGGTAGDRNNILSGASARGSLEHGSGLNNGGMNPSFNRNNMVMNPYMMDSSHASLYAMQAQASMGGFHPIQQFAPQPGNIDFQQQQAAMYHMSQNPHLFVNGLAGSMGFGNGQGGGMQAGGIPSYDETSGNQGQQSGRTEGNQERESPVPKPKKKETKKKRKKKPKDCPRRPLSGYNLFFKDERKRILEAIPTSERDKKPKDPKDDITWPGKKRAPHGKIGFESLAKTIGARWKEIDPERLKHYKDLATQDLHRYAREMKEYEAKLSSGQIKEPSSDDDDDDSEEEAKPVKAKKRNFKTKKRAASLKQDDIQDSNKKARGMDQYPYHLQQHTGDGKNQFPVALSAGNNMNFGPSDSEQFFQLQKIQQNMFGGFSFNDGNTNLFGESYDSSNQGLPSFGNSSDFEPPSKKNSENM